MNNVSEKTDLEVAEIIRKIEAEELSEASYSLEVQKHLDQFFKKISTTTTAKTLSSKTQAITAIANRLSFSNFIKFHEFIDSSFPGLSFHYVMEARHDMYDDLLQKVNYTRYKVREPNAEQTLDKSFYQKENTVYILRLKRAAKEGLLGLMFAPMRKRLISGLLNEDLDDDTSHFLNKIISGEEKISPEVLSEEKFIQLINSVFLEGELMY